MHERMLISRRDVLRAAAAAALAPGALARAGTRAAADKPAKKPNLLVIVTDQQHAGMMSCAGSRWLRTPAMDSLAATGTRFEQAYAANPVCLPSRFSLLTGLYPSAVGVRHNGSKPAANVADMPQRAMGWLFRNAGYETAYGGKVHLPGPMGNVAKCGFDVLSRDQRGPLAEACAAFLRREHDRPFLLFASFINPHDICFMAIRDHDAASGLARQTPRELDEALKPPAGCSREEFLAKHCPPLPENFEPPDGESEAIELLLSQRPFRMNARRNWTAQRWREHRWAYCRLTERVDAEIAAVLAALRESGRDRDTVVLLTSDHGDMDSAHRMEHKTAFYEEATRIPLIVSAPGRTKAGAVDRTHLACNGLDLIPTLCDYAGIAPPAGLAGASLRGLAEGKPPAAWRDELVIESEIGYALRTERHKYSLFDTGARREMLVDLQSDGGEMKNLAGAADHAATLADHRRRLLARLTKAGVAAAAPEGA